MKWCRCHFSPQQKFGQHFSGGSRVSMNHTHLSALSLPGMLHRLRTLQTKVLWAPCAGFPTLLRGLQLLQAEKSPHTGWWPQTEALDFLCPRYPPEQLMQEAAGAAASVLVKRISEDFSTISISIHLHPSLGEKGKAVRSPHTRQRAPAPPGWGMHPTFHPCLCRALELGGI